MVLYTTEKINIVPFSSLWTEQFEKEVKQLKSAFKDIDLEFFHIGSTSIPGCSAKPVIDILGVTPDILEIDHFNQQMVVIGFKPLGENGMKQRRYFHKTLEVAVNLHIFEKTDPEIGRHLRFCNYLRHHPDKVKEYSEIKAKLATQFPHDIQKYILGKESFIKGIDIVAAWETSPNPLPNKELPKRSKWTLEEILNAMHVNMHLQMTYFAKYIPTMELVFEPDVTVVRASIPDDTFNYVLSAAFQEENATSRVTHVLSLFKKYHLPFSWWVSQLDTPPFLSDVLLSEGLAVKEQDIGMYAELLHLEIPPVSSPLSFQRVISPTQLKQFAGIITAIGGSSQSFDFIYSKLPPVLYCGASPFSMYIGYLDGLPVITGILVAHANVAGIYYIATIPEQRRKGFGTAMMHHLLGLAKEKGYFIATLQASAEGFSLYERLGFKRCCQFVEYIPKQVLR